MKFMRHFFYFQVNVSRQACGDITGIAVKDVSVLHPPK